MPIILDAELRPGDVERLACGRLGSDLCPACAFEFQISGPVLLLTRTRTPHFIFCCNDSSAPENEQDLAVLIDVLREQTQVPEAWWEENVQLIEHRFLPYLLRPIIAPEAGQWVAPIQWQLLILSQQPTQDTNAAHAVLNLYPELLWVSAERTLNEMTGIAEERGDDDAAGRFRYIDSLLIPIRLVNGLNLDPLRQS